jgi:hypothetical protein
MSSTSQHADPIGGDVDGSAPKQLYLQQRLRMLELQLDLDAQNIAQLREQNAALENALDAERACAVKHADALMRIARTCDDRVDDLKALHTGVVAKLENQKAVTQRTRHQPGAGLA